MALTFLKDLQSPSIGYWQKLMAAWDGLNIETQIDILSQVKVLEGPDNLKYDLCKQALKSKNSYVRYAAAKWIIPYINSASFIAKYATEESKLVKLIDTTKVIERNEVLNLIKNDNSDLVKYSEFESEERGYFESSVKKEFWQLPHKARLALMRSCSQRFFQGDSLLHLIKDAVKLIESNTLSWEEVDEVLIEFACHNFIGTSWHTRDYWPPYSPNFALSDLWKIIPLLKDDCAEEYIKRIPYVEDAWVDFEELIKLCSNRQLEIILNREEIKLSDIRKGLFFEEKTSDAVKFAAIRFHFYPTDEEFDKILDKYTRKKRIKEKERDIYKIQLLGDIGSGSHSLSLCMYQAILDLMEDKNNWDEWSYNDRSHIAYNMENRLKSLDVSKYASEIFKLRLYQFASRVSKTNNYPYDECVAFLENHVVHNNSWKTFIAFKSVWHKGRQEDINKRNAWLREEEYVDFNIVEYEEKSDEINEIKEKLIKLEGIINELIRVLKWPFIIILVVCFISILLKC